MLCSSLKFIVHDWCSIIWRCKWMAWDKNILVLHQKALPQHSQSSWGWCQRRGRRWRWSRHWRPWKRFLTCSSQPATQTRITSFVLQGLVDFNWGGPFDVTFQKRELRYILHLTHRWGAPACSEVCSRKLLKESHKRLFWDKIYGMDMELTSNLNRGRVK